MVPGVRVLTSWGPVIKSRDSRITPNGEEVTTHFDPGERRWDPSYVD